MMNQGRVPYFYEYQRVNQLNHMLVKMSRPFRIVLEPPMILTGWPVRDHYALYDTLTGRVFLGPFANLADLEGHMQLFFDRVYRRQQPMTKGGESLDKW